MQEWSKTQIVWEVEKEEVVQADQNKKEPKFEKFV
jgi:hypothetical protein